jgi:hypothetical protein
MSSYRKDAAMTRCDDKASILVIVADCLLTKLTGGECMKLAFTCRLIYFDVFTKFQLMVDHNIRSIGHIYWLFCPHEKKETEHILYKRQYRDVYCTRCLYRYRVSSSNSSSNGRRLITPTFSIHPPQEEVNEEIVKQTGATQSLFFAMKCTTVECRPEGSEHINC